MEVRHTLTGTLLEKRYRVGRLIANGGMSTVYRGVDVRLDRQVAIKVMEPRLAGDAGFRRRFEREARSAAKLDHPGIVAVYDQGEHIEGVDEPLVFLVMELVDGGTLRDVLRSRGALGVGEAIAILDPVLAALSAAHRHGLVHRDIKPENVLISQTRAVKVADFGLVTAAAESGASTSGVILGTVAYLAPEQVASGVADSRSDVYAAGVVLYEMLTGSPPYRGDTALSVAYRHVNEDVPAPSSVVADIPEPLDQLTLQATRRDPATRPADAGAFLDALRGVRLELGIPRVGVPLPPPREPAEPDTEPVGPPPGGRQHTRAMGREELPRAAAAPAAVAVLPAGKPPHVVNRVRSRRSFATWTAVVVVLGVLIATVAWWLGSGRWTAMPSLVGLDRTAAERVLSDADLVAAVSERHDNSVPAGTVTVTQPTAESRLLRGSDVTLTVSTGRPTVPAVAAGTAVAEAERLIRAGDLTPRQDNNAVEYSQSVPQGAVVRTQPAAGTSLPISTAVTLVISRGPAPTEIDVPFLIGKSVDEAKSALEDVGLKSKVRDRFRFGGDNGGDDGDNGNATVVLQQPDPGTTVRPGSTVTLTSI